MNPRLSFLAGIAVAAVTAALFIWLPHWLPGDTAAGFKTLGFALGWVGSILVGLLGMAVIYRMFTGTIDLSKLVSEGNGDASMARFQFLVFTFVITLCLLVITVSNSSGPQFPTNIPPEILGLLGISAGSYVISKSLQNNQTGPNGTDNTVANQTAAAAAPPVSATVTPAAVAGVAGQGFTLTAAAPANAGKLTYQWQRAAAGSTDWEPVPGQTGSMLPLTLAAEDHGAQYRCKVGNAGGSVASAPVVVTLHPDRG